MKGSHVLSRLPLDQVSVVTMQVSSGAGHQDRKKTACYFVFALLIDELFLD